MRLVAFGRSRVIVALPATASESHRLTALSSARAASSGLVWIEAQYPWACPSAQLRLSARSSAFSALECLERDLSGSTRSAIRVMAFAIIQAAFARGPGSPQITDGSRTVLISDASWSAASYPSGA